MSWMGREGKEGEGNGREERAEEKRRAREWNRKRKREKGKKREWQKEREERTREGQANHCSRDYTLSKQVPFTQLPRMGAWFHSAQASQTLSILLHVLGACRA